MSRLIMLMVVLAMPLSAFGAEPVKLKYTTSMYVDAKGVALNQPEGIACNEDLLVVADTGNARLVLYTLQGGEVTGGTEIKLPQVLYPVRLAITSKGDLLVLDERQRKVARITRDGVFKAYVEPSGLPAQTMIIPAGLGVDADDNLYLLDALAGRILVLNADGQFQRQINFPKEYGFITDLAVDPKGTVFAVDAVKSVVYSTAKDPAVLTPITGTLKEDLKFPSNIMTDKKGTLYISDQNGGGIVAIGQDGTFRNRMLSLGWKEGAVRYPTQTCVDKDGSLFVADRANNRIQKFTPLK
jgi:hypothetical protein